MKKDFARLYFQAFQKIGVNTELQLFRMKGSEVIEKVRYDHADFDGISAIMDLAQKIKSVQVIPPAIHFSPEPPLLEKLGGLFRWYVRFFPFKASFWKTKGKGQRVSAWLDLKNPAGLSSADLNARLLVSLDQASRKYLQNPDRSRMWMIPVALYEKIDSTITGGNNVSFIDVKIEDATTVADVKANIRSDLKQKIHWGTLLTLKPAAVIGVTLFSLFLRIAHLSFRRTGTLTNMGEWKISGLDHDEWWIFGDGMVALMNPVVATAMIVNGRLGISIIMHESLGLSSTDAQTFLREWEKFFEAN